jgi:hypothetical protein
MRYRKLHPITDDWRRQIDIRVLTKARAFKRPTRFPFMHVEVTAPDHIKVFRVGDKSCQSPQIVAVTWRKMTFGYKPFLFVRDAMQGALFFITTAYFAIVGHALIFGTGVSANIAGRGYCIDHTSCAFGSVIRAGHRATRFQPGQSGKENPPIAASSPS